MALQSTEEPWAGIKNLSQVTLLRNVYDHDLSRDEDERVEDDELGRNQHPNQSPDFYQGRETMASWTPVSGWEANAKVIEECRAEEEEFMVGREIMSF